MAKEQGSRNVSEVTDRQMMEELIRIHAQAAGESISSILRANIEIGEPELQEITVREVEYSILEPAVFVKTCLTSQVAGSLVLILRQRDMQAMSAAGELMNQMGHASAAAMAQFLGDTMDFADCQLTLSDGRQSLASVMGEAEDSGVLAVTYRMKIKDMVESEFIECISANAMDSLYQEIQARKEAETRAKQEEEEAARQAALLEQSSIVGKGALPDADQAEGKDDEAGELANAGGRRTGCAP